MAIEIGDKLPEGTLTVATSDGPQARTTDEIFAGKKVVLFAVPGAFTPLCSARHLPGYIQSAKEIKARGVDTIVCLAVNDAFGMGAWGEAQNAGEQVLMAADGSAEFTKALGLDFDASKFGMGVRAQRFAAIYGSEAGNMALRCMALGGVMIGGGIAPKMLPVLKNGSFLESFTNKGRFSEVLRGIEVSVALAPRTPLRGAAEVARRL